MLNASLIIDGNDTAAQDGGVFQRIGPIGADPASVAPAGTVADAVLAVDAAAAAFATWKETGPGERRRLLNEAARCLEHAAPALAEAMVAELGATELWAKTNLHLGAEMLLEAAALTTQVSGQVIPSDVQGSISLAVRQPAGVCLGIAPWNAPVILAVRAVAAALACGNTVVLKGSELCPMTHYLVARCFVDAGFPPGAVNYVVNAPKDAAAVVEALIAHPATRRVNFTGSTKVGRVIGGLAATHMKPALLELGGKAPLLILEDADLDEAVNAAAFGAFANCGQICMSTERVIVAEAIADAFADKLVARVSSFAPPRAQRGPLGSVVGSHTVTHCRALIDEATAMGARILLGGTADGTFMDATIVDGVTPAMRVFREESFGPMVGLVRFKDEAQAIALANDSEYGLSAAIFSRDINRAMVLARQVDSGICHINGPTVHDEPQMPFGGMKESGLGRFGGDAGIEAFTELRWISIQTTPRRYPF
ncbi:aldehyde dehydrogenase family protein [Pigmentiphaga sp. YJ18]|uniref:aldehyde dehydrogenase family protein n=1 Tax=Pigmentiphaga sp. YJ18 TaxID=3134907 RepID=UPI0031136374